METMPDGGKELVGVLDGYRESEQSWSGLLLSLRQWELQLAPSIAVGDGGMDFPPRRIWRVGGAAKSVVRNQRTMLLDA